MRLLNLIDQGHLQPDPDLVEPLYHCVACGRCQVFCRHGNPVAEILIKSRERLLARGLPVPEAFRVEKGGCKAEALPEPFNANRTDQPAFLPSCVDLDGAEGAARVRRFAENLCAAGLILAIPEMSSRDGCGFGEWEAGQPERGRVSWRRFLSQAASYPQVVVDCGQALWAFGDVTAGGGRRVVHLIEWLDEHLFSLPQGRLDRPVAIHDSDFEVRRLGLGANLRRVVKRLSGHEPLSLFEAEQAARSCASSGQWAKAFPVAHARAVSAVLADVADSGTRIAVAANPHCRHALLQEARRSEARSATGEEIEIFDLMDLINTAVRGH